MNYIIIRNYILSFLLSIIGICYAELDLDSINESKDWKFIQEGNINLKWTTYQGYPMCRVSTLLPYAIDSISKIIEDVENYPDIFKRVHNVQILDKNMVRIMLDMPLFLSNRDYVVQYKKNKKITKWEFSFNAVTHKNAPIDKNYVRLINAAGKWELYPKTKNETLLSYTWNGELLGDFPDFALKRAWKTQGNEIIHWITNALK